MLRVTLHTSTGSRETFEFLDTDRVTFGRSANCLVTLNANYVSRQHGEFVCEDGQWYLQDCCSKIGVTLIRGSQHEPIQNSEQSQRRAIHGGETVQLLNISMRVEVNPEDDALPAPSDAPDIAPAPVTQMADLRTQRAIRAAEGQRLHRTLQTALRGEGHKIGMLFDLAKDLNILRDLDDILGRIGHAVFDCLRAATDYAVCIKDAVTDEYTPVFGMLRDGTRVDTPEIAISQATIDLALQRETAILLAPSGNDLAPTENTTTEHLSSSMAVPLRGTAGFIGVMQIDNCSTGAPFSKADLDLIMVLASSTAFAVERARLQASIQRMFDGFVDASVAAIEARDPTTSGHSRRVAGLTVALAEATTREVTGKLADVSFDAAQLKEIAYAGLLHDFGKVAVREDVLVKANRLYPADLERIEQRFKLIRVSYRASLIARAFAGRSGDAPSANEALRWIEGKATKFNRSLEDIASFLRTVNCAGRLTDDQRARVGKIAQMTWIDEDGSQEPFLSDIELGALTIPRGTLTLDERKEIETHVHHTVNFLSQIPWSDDLRNIASIVHAHHEKLDGSGYPRGIDASEIPVQAKMLTVCDIFDAITASDRPYRSAMPIERGLEILQLEAKAGKIDRQFVALFIRAGVWKHGTRQDGSAHSSSALALEVG